MSFKTTLASAVFVLSAGVASAATVDSFDVDATNGFGTTSTAVLDNGAEYILTVSGTYRIGRDRSRNERFADAEYFDTQSGTPMSVSNNGVEIGIGVDGMDIDFGAYSPNNVYTATIFGDGSTINVFLSDRNYRDNAGFLSVTIDSVNVAPVPLPATLPLALAALGGLGWMRRRRG